MTLDALRSLQEQASPGPWHAWDRGIGWEVHGVPPHDDGEHYWFREPTEDDLRKGYGCPNLNDGFRETMTEADAKLVAVSKNHLLSLAEALEKIVGMTRDSGLGAVNSEDIMEGIDVLKALQGALE